MQKLFIKSKNYREMSISRTNRKDSISAYIMVSPTVVLFVLFCIYPLIYVFRVSFYEYNGMTDMTWIGLYNYARVMRDASWWNSVFNTIQLGILVPLVQIPISLTFAILLNGKIKGESFFRTFLFMPSVTSTAIMGVIFWFMFATFGGVVNNLLMSAHIIPKAIDWLGRGSSAKMVIVLFNTWASTGFYMILFLAGLQRIPKDVFESAAVDGAGGLRTLLSITIPMLGNMFRIIVMLSMLNALKLFDTVKVLTNGGPGNSTEVMTMYVYKYFFEPGRGTMQHGYASAVAMSGLIVIGIMTAIYFVISRKSANQDG